MMKVGTRNATAPVCELRDGVRRATTRPSRCFSRENKATPSHDRTSKAVRINESVMQLLVAVWVLVAGKLDRPRRATHARYALVRLAS